jgi:hypothetical protein
LEQHCLKTKAAPVARRRPFLLRGSTYWGVGTVSAINVSPIIIVSAIIVSAGHGAGAGAGWTSWTGSMSASVSAPPHAASATADAANTVRKERFMKTSDWDLA